MHHHSESPSGSARLAALFSAVLFGILLLADTGLSSSGSFTTWRPALYALALLPLALPVAAGAWHELREGEPFNEFLLMLLAAVGAFILGEYPEAVAVLLFYAAGEALQQRAVERARRDVSHLAELRPDHVVVETATGGGERRHPEAVVPGETISLPAGGRVPLDGLLLGEETVHFDTAVLTGESLPRAIEPGGEVSAGMIVCDRACRLRVVRPYAESATARIMHLVEEAAERKAPAERFIRRFARWYTPAVIAAAVIVAAAPPLWALMAGTAGIGVAESVRRALVFLVVACPCALVISVPLGYFSSIGLASRLGILFKGGDCLDRLADADAAVFDKTGTLTQGLFGITTVVPADGTEEEELLRLLGSAEGRSTHPLARALTRHLEEHGIAAPPAASVEELPGRGLRATVGGRTVLAGNRRLLAEAGIAAADRDEAGIVHCAADGRYAGYVCLADTDHPDARSAVARLHRLGLRPVCVFSGDREPVVAALARRLGADRYAADLLPEDKLTRLQALAAEAGGHRVLFAGDGINDAPALAQSHVSVAMGGAGSDVAVETADIVVQGRNPARVADAVELARATRRLARLNIGTAIGAKLLVLALGALGQVPLWLAVAADTGVTLLCVLNVLAAMRMAERRHRRSKKTPPAAF